MSSQRPPSGLQTRGRRLWRAVLKDFELSDAEQAILEEACRVADLIDRLSTQLAGEPLTVVGSRGQAVLHPLAGEVRQQRALLAQLIGRLALPEDDVDVAASALGRRAAHARWRKRRG